MFLVLGMTLGGSRGREEEGRGERGGRRKGREEEGREKWEERKRATLVLLVFRLIGQSLSP